MQQIFASGHGKIKAGMRDEESLVILGLLHCPQSLVGIEMTWESGASPGADEKGE